MHWTNPPANWPRIIQGGMGTAVSNWQLARAVALCGHLGVVSGTALNTVLVRRLQDGDKDGAMRRALAACPLPDAAPTLGKYFVPGGIGRGQPYKLAPMFSLDSAAELLGLTAAANFVEVYLAKENHSGAVGINLLEKIQLPTLASLYGAMLAGVDYVLMGAGIPKAIPGILDRFAAGEKAELRIAVEGAAAEQSVEFDPATVLAHEKRPLARPRFLAIVSSSTLALTLARKSSGKVDGFVVEGATAGGHNAPPRGGGQQLNERGEPVYGPRDTPDLAAIRALGLPFWLAGSQATPDALRAAEAAGATGVQIGTAFAFCRESGLTPGIKSAVLQRARGRRRSAHRPARLAHRHAVQGGRSARHGFRPHALRRPFASLRPRLPAHAVRPRRRHHRLPLPGRERRKFHDKGRRCGRNFRPQMSLQWPARRRRPRPARCR
jgi:nitronate monooxygenase